MERNSRPPIPSQAESGSDSTQRPLRAVSISRTEPSPAVSILSILN